MIGERFGRLVVQYLHEKRGYGKRYLCICDCGETTIVFKENLRQGKTTSCGCFRKEKSQQLNLSHGKASSKNGRSSEYKTWSDMKTRCFNSKSQNYPLYGGRGITVCERWSQSFGNFLSDMGTKPFLKAQIDRINNDGNYEPGNCRWVDAFQNSRNRRVSAFITYNGVTATIPEWAEKTGIAKNILYHRLYRGWDLDRIFTQQPRGGKQ